MSTGERYGYFVFEEKLRNFIENPGQGGTSVVSFDTIKSFGLKGRDCIIRIILPSTNQEKHLDSEILNIPRKFEPVLVDKEWHDWLLICSNIYMFDSESSKLSMIRILKG